MKSDNVNGVFSFFDDCILIYFIKENEVVICIVVRNRGDDGVVNVIWVVF